MRKLVVFSLSVLLLFITIQTSLAEGISTEEQARIMQEKQELIQQMKGKSKEEQARMIAEFNQRVFNRKTQIVEQRTENKEELQAKLEEFRNQKKAQIAERVSNNLNKISDNRVNAMMKHLDRLQEILNKLTERVTAAGDNGKDVTAAEGAIADAQMAIDEAKTLVEAQAGEDYTLAVGDETTVKTDAQAKREALMSDLKGVHDKIKAAKDAVVVAIRTSAGLIGKEGVDKEENEQ